MRKWPLLSTIAISNVTSSSIALALPMVAITNFSASASEVALITSIAASAPLVFGLHSGIVADRNSYTFVAKTSFALRFLVCLLCSVALYLEEFSIGIAALTLFAMNAASLYFESAAWAVVPRIASGEDRIGFNAYHEAILSTAALVAPWLSAFAVDGGRAHGFLVGCAVSMVCCLAFIRKGLGPTPLRSNDRPSAGILDGVKYIFQDPLQRAVSWSAMIFNFFHAAFFAVFTFYALKVLDISVAGVAVIFFITAVGGTMGAFVAPFVIGRYGAYQAAIWSMSSLLPTGIPLIIAPFVPRYAPAFICVTFVAWEVAILVNVIAETTLRQERSPQHMVGSVASASRFVNWGADPLGAALAALLLVSVDSLVVLALAFLGMAFAFVPLLLNRNRGCAPIQLVGRKA